MKHTFSKVEFECPHCKFINKYHSHEVKSFRETEIVSCNDEDGGCGTEIVLVSSVKIDLTLKAMKIEGINQQNL
ncbi:hypothetical protein [Dokdonia sp.]|uniref:hypothetical protein n=1 Tax=Dokdonia sp. TaxID=2024995 RepID=UPI0032676E43